MHDHGRAIIQELESYWVAKCKPGELPLRSMIDPTDIPHLLPYVFLVKVIEEPRDFYCVLAGEHIITIGRNIVGVYISQLAQEIPAFQSVFEDCIRAANSKIPIQGLVNFLSPQGIYKSSSYGILPLAVDDHTTSSMLLGAVVFQQKEISQLINVL